MSDIVCDLRQLGVVCLLLVMTTEDGMKCAVFLHV